MDDLEDNRLTLMQWYMSIAFESDILKRSSYFSDNDTINNRIGIDTSVHVRTHSEVIDMPSGKLVAKAQVKPASILMDGNTVFSLPGNMEELVCEKIVKSMYAEDMVPVPEGGSNVRDGNVYSYKGSVECSLQLGDISAMLALDNTLFVSCDKIATAIDILANTLVGMDVDDEVYKFSESPFPLIQYELKDDSKNCIDEMTFLDIRLSSFLLRFFQHPSGNAG